MVIFVRSYNPPGLTCPSPAGGSVDTAGVRCGCGQADSARGQANSPLQVWGAGEGASRQGRGRGRHPGLLSRSTSDHGGWESCPDPTRQSPREPPVSPGGGVRTCRPQGTPGRGPERGGGGPWPSPRRRGPGLRKGRVGGRRKRAAAEMPRALCPAAGPLRGEGQTWVWTHSGPGVKQGNARAGRGRA